MTTPNAMPRNNNPIRMQILEGLISISPVTTEFKVLEHDENGKETVTKVKKVHRTLRYPLAQNMTEENVEALSRRWLK